MARMHTSKRGKSSSKKPFSLRLRRTVPEWVEMTAEEVEKKVEDLANQGLSTSKMGIILRDSYGVPSVALVTGKRMTRILKEKKKVGMIPEDLQNLIEKALKLRKHIEEHKNDVHHMRVLQLTESKIRRLVKYYRREKVLPEDWKYKPEVAEVILRK